MPGELFLGGVASCAVELVQMFARDDGLSIGEIHAQINAELDPDHQPRPDRTLFNRVHMRIEIEGVSQTRAEELVDRFKGR